MIRFQMRRVVAAIIIAKWIFHLSKGRIKIKQDHHFLKLIVRIIVAKIARIIRIMIRKVVAMLITVVILRLLLPQQQQELRIQETE